MIEAEAVEELGEAVEVEELEEPVEVDELEEVEASDELFAYAEEPAEAVEEAVEGYDDRRTRMKLRHWKKPVGSI